MSGMEGCLRDSSGPGDGRVLIGFSVADDTARLSVLHHGGRWKSVGVRVGKNSNLHASCSPPLKRQACYKRSPKTAADWMANRFVELNASACAVSHSLRPSPCWRTFSSATGSRGFLLFFHLIHRWLSISQSIAPHHRPVNWTLAAFLVGCVPCVRVLPLSHHHRLFWFTLPLRFFIFFGGPLSFSIYVQWTSGPVTKINGSRLNIHCMCLPPE